MKLNICFFIFLFLYNLVFAQPFYIYNDSLVQKGWDASYSWDTKFNLKSTEQRYSGNYSIAIEYQKAYAGFSIHTANLNTSDYDTLVFYVNGGSSGNQSFQIKVSYDGRSYNSGTDVSNYTTIVANQWSVVKIPLTHFGANNTNLTAIAFQENKGIVQPKFYIDNIYLIGLEGIPKIVDTYLSSYNFFAEEIVHIRVKVEASNLKTDVKSVYADLSSMDISAPLILYDDGNHNDLLEGDGVYGNFFRTSSEIKPGEYGLHVSVISKNDRLSTKNIWIAVNRKIKLNPPSKLPAYLSLGTATTSGSLVWQTNNCPECWDFGYQYITWEWWEWYNEFVKRFCDDAASRGFIPVIPIYQFYPASEKFGCFGSEYDKIYCTINNNELMTIFWNRFIQMCEEANRSTAQKVIFHFEPDMFGYLQLRAINENKNPNTLTAIVNDTNYPNTLRGMIKRIVDLVRIYCPDKGLIATHISPWSNGFSIKNSTLTYVNTDSLAKRTAEFLMGCSDQVDLLFIDWSDRDAGFDGEWWSNRNNSYPNFSRMNLFTNSIAYYTGKPIVLWQIPVGNEKLDNSPNHYQDNRLDYCFDYPKDMVKSGIIAMLFGAAIPNMTSQFTDGNNLLNRAKEYIKNGRLMLNFIDTAIVVIPKEFNLKQNFPNPFSSYTYFEYKLPALKDKNGAEKLVDYASLKIYNSLGQEVATIFNELKFSGEYKYEKFSPSKYNLASGVYFAELKFGEYRQVIKMLLIR